MDGRAAAAVVQRHEGTVELRPHSYGLPRPTGAWRRRVYLVDLALTLADMQELAREASELHWYDHHESSVRLREALGWGVIRTDQSGSMLTWHELFPGEAPPTVLAYVEDKDLWRWQLHDSRAINAGLAERFSSGPLDGLLDADLDEMAELGRPVLDRQKRRIDVLVAQGMAVREPYGLRGAHALVVNSLEHVSELGERIYSSREEGGLGYDLAICFALRSDGKWIHCLRSTSVDCRIIAEARGGGGHRCAAAYLADEPFPGGVDCVWID